MGVHVRVGAAASLSIHSNCGGRDRETEREREIGEIVSAKCVGGCELFYLTTTTRL